MDDIIECPGCNKKNQASNIEWVMGADNIISYKMFFACQCGVNYFKQFNEMVDYGYRTRHTTWTKMLGVWEGVGWEAKQVLFPWT